MNEGNSQLIHAHVFHIVTRRPPPCPLHKTKVAKKKKALVSLQNHGVYQVAPPFALTDTSKKQATVGYCSRPPPFASDGKKIEEAEESTQKHSEIYDSTKIPHSKCGRTDRGNITVLGSVTCTN